MTGSGTAVVTGAGSGIGAAIANRLSDDGYTIAVADIDGEAARNCAGRICDHGGRATAHHVDAGSVQDWQRLRSEINGPPVEVLVNNAYTLTRRPAHAQTPEEWDRQIGVNLSAIQCSVRSFMPALTRAGGSMINIASVHAVHSLPGHAAYAATKAAALGLTRQLAIEYGPRVRVNAVLPGAILTPTWAGVDEAGRADAAGTTALHRLGRPEEVAAVVSFLVSAEASYVTGAEILVDGGQSARLPGR